MSRAMPRALLSVAALLLWSCAENPVSGPAPAPRYGAAFNPLPSVIVSVSSGQSPEAVAVAHGLTPRYVYTVINGFAASVSDVARAGLMGDARVSRVEADRGVSLHSVASWGIDRIDQRGLPLSGSYTPPNGGDSVTAYIVDTGIRYTHAEFGGRASFGWDVEPGWDGSDCAGHGTHVAGTVGGTTVGVAHAVHLVSVRIFGWCSTSTSTSDVIAGLDYVSRVAHGPSVVNMSIGGGVSSSLDDAVASLVRQGVVVVVAAGNNSSDACNYSPSREPSAITVGATVSTDYKASYSNYGPCLDLFAPGTGIVSASWSSDTGTATMSGTSMATPHVTGVVALLLTENTAWSPAEVDSVLKARASKGVVMSSLSPQSNLLYSGLDDDNRNVGEPPPVIVPAAPSNATIRWVTAGTANGRTYADVSLKWTDNADNEAGFEMSGVSSSGATTSITGIPVNTTALAVRLPAGMTWSLKVRAVGVGAFSDWSQPATICLAADGNPCGSAPPPPPDTTTPPPCRMRGKSGKCR